MSKKHYALIDFEHVTLIENMVADMGRLNFTFELLMEHLWQLELTDIDATALLCFEVLQGDFLTHMHDLHMISDSLSFGNNPAFRMESNLAFEEGSVSVHE